MLKPNEKGYYKGKLAEKRKNYDKIRHKFFRIEESVDKVWKEYETERRARYRLTDGIAEIHRQGDQLIDIKRVGLETTDRMRAVNRDLTAQRDVIISTRNKTHNISINLTRADKTIQRI